jgi:competence protein ComEC
MSFAASGALIATYEAWSRRRADRERILGPTTFTWASLFVTSLVAGMATAPFAIYHFDRVAAFGLLANLLAMPIITFVSAPLAALSLILTPFGFGDLGLRLFGYSLEAVLAIANWCSSLPAAAWALPKSMPAATLVLCAATIACAMAARGGARIVLATVMLVPAIMAWYGAPEVIAHWSPSGDLFLREEAGVMTRYELADGDGLAPLRYSNVEKVEGCGSPRCVVQLRSGVASIQTTSETGPKVEITSGNQNITLTWPETDLAGGMTIRSGPKGLEQVSAPGCGKRPWRACDQS